MTFKEYLARLNQLLKERPELATATVIYSSDDEGNSFQKVIMSPTPWHFSGYEFIDEDYLPHKKINAVCIN